MPEKTIGLTGAFEATDKHGTPWLVQSLSIEAKGYIPDVRVQLHLPYQTALPDDEIFLAQVMAQLHKIGYEGEPVGRAELGMQGPDYVMLEPSRGFRAFAKTLGWQDLAESDPCPGPCAQGPRRRFRKSSTKPAFRFGCAIETATGWRATTQSCNPCSAGCGLSWSGAAQASPWRTAWSTPRALRKTPNLGWTCWSRFQLPPPRKLLSCRRWARG